jgi:hypothetical protein
MCHVYLKPVSIWTAMRDTVLLGRRGGGGGDNIIRLKSSYLVGNNAVQSNENQSVFHRIMLKASLPASHWFLAIPTLQPSRWRWHVEMLVDFQWITQCYIPEDITLHNQHCEDLKSDIDYKILWQVIFSWLMFAIVYKPIHKETPVM